MPSLTTEGTLNLTSPFDPATQGDLSRITVRLTTVEHANAQSAVSPPTVTTAADPPHPPTHTPACQGAPTRRNHSPLTHEILQSKLYAYAQELAFAKWPSGFNCRDRSDIINHIKSIDGIPVQVSLFTHGSLIIYHASLCSLRYSDCREQLYVENISDCPNPHMAWTPRQIYDFIDTAIKSINQLRMDRISGKFVKSSELVIGQAKVAFMRDQYETNTDTVVKIGIEKCAVCYELTATYTGCDHPLCMHCWSAILKKTPNAKVCPICRKSIGSKSLEFPDDDGDNDDDDMM